MTLASKHGGYYLDFLAEARLGSDDYHDVSHLLPSGRPSTSACLCRTAPVVPSSGDGDAPRRYASLPVAARPGAGQVGDGRPAVGPRATNAPRRAAASAWRGRGVFRAGRGIGPSEDVPPSSDLPTDRVRGTPWPRRTTT